MQYIGTHSSKKTINFLKKFNLKVEIKSNFLNFQSQRSCSCSHLILILFYWFI